MEKQIQQIPLFKVFMNETVPQSLSSVLMSGYITQGPKVDEFEKELIKFIGNPYLLTLNSATSGLMLALKLLLNNDFDVNNDIVLTPALTCFATTASLLAYNVNIRWIDVDPKTMNVNLDDLRNKLSEKTKIIYVVHWAGYPVDLDELKNLQEYSYEKFGFRPMIVEDCAHAFGATYKGKKLGNHGNICVYSLQAIKHLTTGDGGIIVLPNEELYNRAKLLRWYGIDRDRRNYNKKDFRLEHDIVESGYKFHMNDINATIGLNNLVSIGDILRKDRDNAKYFMENLQNINGVTLLENKTDRESAWWLFTILVNRKNEFIEYMKNKNIIASQVHQRNDIHSCVSKFKEQLPFLDVIETQMVCIPVGWWVTENDRQYIVQCIKEFYENSI